jgi:2-C-methyl-D-erythritol 4-phosphate cytidylyltransferase
MIDGQKVQADYSCVSGGRTRTQEIYKIKSAAGNDYAKKTFSEKAYVLVHLNNVPVPFATEGFSKALAEASAKAL